MLTSVEERNPLSRRRLEDYTPLKCRTAQLQRSFLPKSITEWNELSLIVRVQGRAESPPDRSQEYDQLLHHR